MLEITYAGQVFFTCRKQSTITPNFNDQSQRVIYRRRSKLKQVNDATPYKPPRTGEQPMLGCQRPKKKGEREDERKEKEDGWIKDDTAFFLFKVTSVSIKIRPNNLTSKHNLIKPPYGNQLR